MLIYNNVAELTNAKLVVGDLIQLIGENVVADRAPMVGLVRPQGFFSSNRLITISGNLVVEIMPDLIISQENADNSTVLSSGSSTRRSLSERFSDLVSVLDFGAKGDGVTDDTLAFTSAFNSGKPIWVPKTSSFYKITSQVSITQNLNVFGPIDAIVKLSGTVAGGTHFLVKGRESFVQGITFESETRGIIFKVEPSGGNDIDRFVAKDCNFVGGFYGVRAGTSITDTYLEVCKRVVIDNCSCQTTNQNNAGHFICFSVEEVRYLNSKAIGGKNTSAFGAARCGDVVVMGCTERNVAQTTVNVEAGCQIEDSPNGKALLVGNNFEHDIWVSSSSNVIATNNHCRKLRISTGSAHVFVDLKNLSFSNNSTGRIDIQKYGSVVENTQVVSAIFKDNTLDPGSYSHMGTPFSSSYIIQGSQCENIMFSGNINVSDASSESIRLTRGEKMNISIKDCDLGTKPHIISGTGGLVKTSGNIENNITPHGLADIADIVLTVATGSNIEVPTTATAIPFNSIIKNQNQEYSNLKLTPKRSQIYSFDGVIRVLAPQDGVSYRVELVEVTNNNNLLMVLGSGKFWQGYNTINLNKFTVKLDKDKEYSLLISAGSSGCIFEERFVNTAVSITAVI